MRSVTGSIYEVFTSVMLGVLPSDHKGLLFLKIAHAVPVAAFQFMKFSRNPVITGCSENTVVARLKATAAGIQDQCCPVHCSSYPSLALVARPPTLCLQVLAAAAHQSGQAFATLCWYRV